MRGLNFNEPESELELVLEDLALVASKGDSDITFMGDGWSESDAQAS